MSHKIDDNPPLPRSRIRELVAAHEDAVLQWSALSGASRHPENSSSSTGTSQLRRLEEHQDGALMALLHEGMPEDTWVATTKRGCVLIEDGFHMLMLRFVPREAVLLAPEWAPPEAIERNARRLIRSRYHGPVSTIKWVSGCASAVVAYLVAVVIIAFEVDDVEYIPLLGVVDYTTLLGTGGLILMAFLIVYIFADILGPDSAEQVFAEEYEVYGPDAPGDRVLETSVHAPAQGEPVQEPGPSSVSGSADEPRSSILSSDQSVPGPAPASAGRPPGYSLGGRAGDVPERADTRQSSNTFQPPQRSPQSGETYRAFSYEAPESSATGASTDRDMDPNDLYYYQQKNRRFPLNDVCAEDLSESFSSAGVPPYNPAQGSEAVCVTEARGELADILGIERGETVAHVTWESEGSRRAARSFLPYREVLAGTSLDPALPPSQRVRPYTRAALHQRLIAEKGLGSLSPKVTYRLGPSAPQFFNRPYRSGGEQGSYLLEDKLHYLERRAGELGFKSSYTDEEWERIEEIMLRDGDAPTHEELLRFALAGGIDPRFLFEDSHEDLRSSGPDRGNPGEALLWRIEAAISEAHGIPVEIFERALIPWDYSRHAWSFR